MPRKRVVVPDAECAPGVFVRLQPELIALLDARVAELRAELPGHRVTRSDVIRSLLATLLKGGHGGPRVGRARRRHGGPRKEV